MIVREQVLLGQTSILRVRQKSSVAPDVELNAELTLALLGTSCNRPATLVGPGHALLVRVGPAGQQIFCQVFARSQEDAAGGLSGGHDGPNSCLGVGERTAGLI